MRLFTATKTTKRNVLSWALACVLALTGAVLPGCGGGEGEADGDSKTLAFVPKGREHSFWLAVIRGAQKAADENGVELIVQATNSESEILKQVDIVNTLRTEGTDGLILAPLDDDSLLKPVQDFGKPVVIMDSPLNGKVGEDFESFVGTENSLAGQSAAEALAAAMGENKKVVLLRYSEGSASTAHREEGFLKAIGDVAGVEVILSNQYAGTSVSSAQDKAEAMIDTIKEAGGIFTPNESSSVGMLNFLREKGLAGKVKFVGFDASIALVEGLTTGEVTAIVVQDPETMGYKSVMTMLDVLGAKDVEPHVDTGAVVVTNENLADPKVQAILLAYDKLIEQHLPAASE